MERFGDISDGLVYCRKKSPHAEKPDFMQLLLPRLQVKKLYNNAMPKR